MTRDERKEKEPLLRIKDFSVAFKQYEKGTERIELPVIRNLNVDVRPGELVAVVGASGSGKSLLAHGILGILPYNASSGGKMYYKGEELTEGKKEELRGSRIVLIPQSVTFLDPLMKVGKQIRKGRNNREFKEKNEEIFRNYHLDMKTADKYPFELSGGMIRRILLSTALIESPELVIADEPTPGLHMAMAEKVVGHLRELADRGAGVLLITHDLELAAGTADRIVVFYAGTTVEDARASDFDREETLRHPYSKALWRAMPKNGFALITGAQPYAKDMPDGCPYAPRCEYACAECAKEEIPWRKQREGYVRCIRKEEA